MRDPHFAALRDYADNTVRQPDFATVRRRAGLVRRRRAVASSAAAVAAALVMTGIWYTATAGPGDRPAAAEPTPTFSEDPTAGWPRVTQVNATGPVELYGVVERCRDCAPELYASDDTGATWQRRAVPPAPDDASAGEQRHPTLTTLGPGILTWEDRRDLSLAEALGSPPAPSTGPEDGGGSASATELPWITIDGARTWRRAEVDPEPVAAVPPGTRQVDCGLAGQSSPCRIYAVDPVSGRFAPLATQPSGITYERDWMAHQTDVPVGGHLWVPGLDPATLKPAVASSSDGGRTWRTHVFTDGVPAAQGDDGFIATMHLPTVAADADGTAYALTYREDQRQDPHRTTDGGATWQPVPGGAVAEVMDEGFVTADGAHVVTTGREFLTSREGGGYEPVTLPGYPADLREQPYVTSQPADGRYLVFAQSPLYLSDDGWTWRRVDVP